MECLKCNKKMTVTELMVTCCDCKRTSHSKCTKLTDDETVLYRERGLPWRCKACLKHKELFKDDFKKKSKRNDEGMGDSGRAEAKKDLNLTMGSIYEAIIEGDSTVRVSKDDVSYATDSIHALKLKNERLMKEIETLSYRLDMAEQNTKRNAVEITGVPDKKNENLLAIVKQIGVAIEYPMNDEMVDICYRINRQNKDGYHGIMLAFVRRFDKEGFLKCYRQKKGLNAKDLGMKKDSEIYIRESLSLNKQHILLETKKVAKQMNYQGVGVVNGEIFLKKSESVPAILIKDLKDLEKLLNPNMYNNVK
ncbi:uncharacterized protein LOC106669132 [Cimex lectularius]|uniref:PHD-type domain-containing protein n=1 Tax=Cimex lectularius TaxID=79782 RepID=A0A8I6RZZ9_CIMLE|nr:uncharacterized protein LOC106669132 [Cimex lectularius]